jgi:tRNA nucleotidyltransferase (CCA-adding enzyme)
LDKIGTPNSQYKLFALQKRAPQKINDRFLIGLSLKMPISKWLGAYKSGVKERAKKLCIWDAGYEPQITHQKIISLGFKNGEISKNYKLMLSREIREKFRS